MIFGLQSKRAMVGLGVIILGIFAVVVWFGQVRGSNKSAKGESLYEQLSDSERVEWEKITEALVNMAQSGGGDGPAIGQTVDLSRFPLASGEIIDTSKGIYAILSGNTECGVCQFLLDKFPSWERDLGIQTVFIGTGDFAKLNPTIDVIAKGVTQVSTEGKDNDSSLPDELFDTQFSPDPIGFFSTGFVLIDSGLVVFKALGNSAEQRYNIDEIIKSYVLEGTLPQGAEQLSYGKMPDTPIDLVLMDGSTASLPRDFEEGIDIAYIVDPRCGVCEAATEGMIRNLAAIASEVKTPFTVWLLGYDDDGTKEQLSVYATKYPLLKAGVVRSVSAQAKGSHPLQAWSRVLIPESLIFQKGLFVANVPALSINWGSKPTVADASPYIEATKRVLQSLITEN
jgi:hypothetical protein